MSTNYTSLIFSVADGMCRHLHMNNNLQFVHCSGVIMFSFLLMAPVTSLTDNS